MNSFERYQAMLAGRAADFVPRTPILMQFAAEYIGSNYGAFASDYRVLVEANRRCAEDFGMDQVSAISDPYRETQGFGAEIEYVRDGVPRCLRHPLEENKDLDRLPHPNPRECERMLDRIRAVETYREQVGGQVSILGWVEGPIAEAADLRGVTPFLMDLMEDEPFVEELMDRCVETGIAFARAQIEAGADTIGVGDALASQVSPDVYERLVLPRERRLIEAIREAGALVRLHICGNITHLLNGIKTLPISILDVDHLVDMAGARRAVGSGVALAGNLDPASTVKTAPPEAIREAVRRIYEEVGNPFLVNAGCEIPSGTPHENLRALCEPVAWRA
jgi:MtaA/CmuA family methyltransferase